MSDVVISKLAGDVAKELGYASVETLLPPNLFFLNRILLPIYILFYSIVQRARRRGVVVGAFSNISLVFCLFSSLLLRNRLVLFSNHNHSSNNSFVWWAFDRLLRLDSRIVVFDVPVTAASNLNHLSKLENLVRVPHPIPILQPRLKKKSDALRIGYVGRIRAEKNINNTLSLIDSIFNKFKSEGLGLEIEKCLGVPFSDIDNLPNLSEDWSLHDTTAYIEYLKFLSTLDIVVFLYDKASYALRPSGVVSEALAQGVFVVASGGASILSQLTVPVQIGYYIEEISDKALEEIMLRYSEYSTELLSEYSASRTHESVKRSIIEKVVVK